MGRWSWTQPACDPCYRERNPGRQPSRLVERKREVCVYCGFGTTSGIYVRENPATARYPTREKD